MGEGSDDFLYVIANPPIGTQIYFINVYSSLIRKHVQRFMLSI